MFSSKNEERSILLKHLDVLAVVFITESVDNCDRRNCDFLEFSLFQVHHLKENDHATLREPLTISAWFVRNVEHGAVSGFIAMREN
jgi:hypothetical protein